VNGKPICQACKHKSTTTIIDEQAARIERAKEILVDYKLQILNLKEEVAKLKHLLENT
jgi:hypothetical protein